MMALLRRVGSGDLKVSGYQSQIGGDARSADLKVSGYRLQIGEGGGRRPSGLRWALVVITLVLGVAQPQPEAAGRVVTFRLGDGRMLSGLWMEAQDRPAPAVVLVPMLGRSRDEWQTAAQRLGRGEYQCARH